MAYLALLLFVLCSCIMGKLVTNHYAHTYPHKDARPLMLKCSSWFLSGLLPSILAIAVGAGIVTLILILFFPFKIAT